MKRFVQITIVIVVVLAAVYLLLPRPPVLDTSTVFRGDLIADLSTTGIVEAKLSDLAPRIISTVTRLLVQEGDMVRQGQPIALLDASDLQARVAEARAGVSAAREDLSRAEQAVQAQAKQSSAAIAGAKAGVLASEAQLADLRKGARPQEIAQAREAVREAQVQTDKAKSDLRRVETLFQRGAVSAQDRDAARAVAGIASARLNSAREQLDLLSAGPRSDEVAVARAQVAASQARLADASASLDAVKIREREAAIARAQIQRAQAASRAAEAQLDYAVVRSPFAGVVVRKHTEVGEIAGPQAPVYSLASLSHIWVTAEVDEEDIAALALGQRLKITLDAFPGKQTEGVVVRVSRIAEPKAVGRVRAKIVRAKIVIARFGFPMKPGMEVDINGSLPVSRNTVLISNNALIQVGDKEQVFVVQGERVYSRYVTTGLSNYDYTAIIAGLKPGDRVATSMLNQLKSGERVRVRRRAGAAN